MFGDTGGYSFFQESWSLPFAQLTACWMLQPEVERTSGCWCPLRSLPAKLSPHTWFLQWLRALLLLFYCLYIHKYSIIYIYIYIYIYNVNFCSNWPWPSGHPPKRSPGPLCPTRKKVVSLASAWAAWAVALVALVPWALVGRCPGSLGPKVWGVGRFDFGSRKSHEKTWKVMKSQRFYVFIGIESSLQVVQTCESCNEFTFLWEVRGLVLWLTNSDAMILMLGRSQSWFHTTLEVQLNYWLIYWY